MTPTYPGTKLAAAAFLAIILVCYSNCTNEWQNGMAMDPKGDFYMFWNLSNENITIEIQVRTKGYVALGFSPHGGMKGADIVTGWVKGSEVFMQDRYATGNVEPIIDNTQDYEMISGFENKTHTVLRFTRQLETCDPQDLPILDKLMYIIYAWRNDDPVSETNIEYHGAENRGTKVVNPTAPNADDLQLTDDVYAWDLSIPKVTLPPEETTLLCHIIKVPETGVKKHFVGMKVTVPPGYENRVHHIKIYQCNDEPSENDKFNVSGIACKAEVTCPFFIGTVLESQTTKIDILPKHVGMPFGRTDRPIYFAVTIHYNNPNHSSGIIDQTKITFMITEKLRQYDAGLLALSSIIGMVIPPQQENFTISATCPSQCTQKMLPEDGVNVFGLYFHGHLATRKMYLRHFRDGIELPLIAYDTHYDFMYQFGGNLLKEFKVLPGDFLAVQCEYNTTDRESFTWGNVGTHDEMCIGFLFHYPMANLFNSENIQPIKNIVQILKSAESKHMRTNTSNGFQVSPMEYVNNFDVSILTKQDISALSYIQAFGKMEGECSGHDGTKETFAEDYPKNATKYISNQLASCQSSSDGLRNNLRKIE